MSIFLEDQLSQLLCQCGPCYVRFCVDPNIFMAQFLILIVINRLISVVDFLLYGRFTHGRQPRGVESLGLFLNLSKSRLVYDTHRDQGVCSFELIRV